MAKIVVDVMLKPEILDPQGVAVSAALPRLGFTFAKSVRQGKRFEIEIDGVKQILKAGDVFHVPSNVIHGAVCLEKGVLVDVFSPMREDFFN